MNDFGGIFAKNNFFNVFDVLAFYFQARLLAVLTLAQFRALNFNLIAALTTYN